MTDTLATKAYSLLRSKLASGDLKPGDRLVNRTIADQIGMSFTPVREAINSTKPGGKPQAHGKYWQDLLGQTGGHVRFPMQALTEAEKAATREAFETCGLKL